jgi:flagellar protein FlbD
MLTRLGGQPMAVNPDLIEKAEATPDTVITLVDGHKFVVAESVVDVVDRVRAWRASVAAEAFAMSDPAPSVVAPSAGAPVDGSWVDGSRADSSRVDGSRTLPGEDGEVAAGGAGGSGGHSLARVLRMPAREE